MRTPRSAQFAYPLALLALVWTMVSAPPAHAEATTAALVQAEARLASRFTASGVAYPPAAVTLVALKAEGRLELWASQGEGSAWAFVRSYLVQATSGKLGPKLREGDHQVPEGVYRVAALNPTSRYHLSLRLDYPNDFDVAHGRQDGRSRLGGDIMIHGDRVSDGCVPIGDRAVEEVFALAERVGVENLSVIVSPLDLRRVDAGVAAARVAQRPRWLAELYAEIATALRSFTLTPASEDAASPDPALACGLAPAPPRSAARRDRAGAPKCKAYDAADCVRHCHEGDVPSCVRAGILYGDGRGVPSDADRAWPLLEEACAAGDPLGCSVLSERLIADDGARRDAARAADLAEAACDRGDGHGCYQLAVLCTDQLIYPTSRGQCSVEQVERLRERAVAALQWDCRGWGAYDCQTLAAIYAPGDAGTARRLARGACDAGDPGGCDELGRLYESEGDTRRARDMYDRACASHYARACARIAPAAPATLAALR